MYNHLLPLSAAVSLYPVFPLVSSTVSLTEDQGHRQPGVEQQLLMSLVEVYTVVKFLKI